MTTAKTRTPFRARCLRMEILRLAVTAKKTTDRQRNLYRAAKGDRPYARDCGITEIAQDAHLAVYREAGSATERAIARSRAKSRGPREGDTTRHR